jgi:uncharacterized protein YndB with AHSA1/START domain
MTETTMVHGTFTVERRYDTAPARVYRAWADAAIKRRWFVEGEGWQIDEFSMDFRVGGREFSRFRFQGGPEITAESVYQDIVPERRIVVTYVMTVAGKRISVSLATTQIEAAGGGTKLVCTEQGVYFDDPEALRNREAGFRELLEQLDKELKTHR